MDERKPARSRGPRSGIYLIRCKPTTKVYVGSAVRIRIRWGEHRRQLTKGTHCNSLLQRAWNKHSPDAFEWVILEHVEPERLIEREQHYIDLFRTRDRKHGFNFCEARSPLGRKLSVATRAKMSRSQREAYLRVTPEEKARRSEVFRRNYYQFAQANLLAAQVGSTRSPEARARMADAHRGKKLSMERRAKMSEAQRNCSPEIKAERAELFKRNLHSPEARAKAKAILGSPEVRAKNSERQRGTTASPETRAKMSAAKLGKAKSPETRARMREAQARRWMKEA